MNYLGAMVFIATLGLALGGPAVMGLESGFSPRQEMQAIGHGMDGCGGCQCSAAGHGMMHQHEHRMADHDGDGIPNCQDEDWVPPEDGTGHRHQGCWS